MHRLNPPASKGFSLVEMAIVIDIIGLLVGGVLAGQNLMRAAEIRSIIEEEQRILGAVQAFQDKYAALPGDMSNATSVWGALPATPATCKAAGQCISYALCVLRLCPRGVFSTPHGALREC